MKSKIFRDFLGIFVIIREFEKSIFDRLKKLYYVKSDKYEVFMGGTNVISTNSNKN